MAKMSKKELEGLGQVFEMHFAAFQKFMEMTGGNIGLSLQLATSFSAALMKGTQEQSESEKDMMQLLTGIDGKGMLN